MIDMKIKQLRGEYCEVRLTSVEKYEVVLRAYLKKLFMNKICVTNMIIKEYSHELNTFEKMLNDVAKLKLKSQQEESANADKSNHHQQQVYLKRIS